MNKFLEQLRSLDPSDPGRWPIAFRLGAIGLITILATGVLGYFLAWSPNRPDLDAARAEESGLMSQLEQKAHKAANLDAYKAQLEEIQQSFGVMLRKLPNRAEVPNLLIDISQAGLDAGLDQKLFQPGPENHKDFYAELPYRIHMTGNFHSIATFVSNVAALPRIVTLHDVQITPVAKGAIDQLQLDVTAKTYRYLDEDEQAAQQPKKGAKNAQRS
jgi:type IV pilus assembly protein PilO